MSASTAQNIEDIYPLSPLQQGLLFQTLLHPDSGVYLMQDRYRIGGDIDKSAFLQAWRQVVAMHPALRTSFLWKTQKEPLQVVHKTVADPVTFTDLRDRTPAQRETYIQDLLQEEQRRGFNLAKPPLIHFRLVQLENHSYELIRSFHHILMDAWCISLVMVDFLNIYDALLADQTPSLRQPRPYRDYIAWLQQQDPIAAQTFWQHQLQGLDAPTPLAIEQAPRQDQYREAVLVDDCTIHLDQGQSQKLTAFCQAQRITPNTLFQGAWALLLSRYSGNSEVLFGVTVAGRPPQLAGVEDMIGLFINTLPLRVAVDEEQTLVSWLKALQSRNLAMREFEHCSLVDIQGWSDFPRGEELFDSIFVYENAPIDTKLLRGDFSFRLEGVEHGVHTHYGLTVVVLPGERPGVRISYDRQRFDRDSIERLLGHLRQLLLHMLAQPASSLATFDVLTAPERQQILEEWNCNEKDFPLHNTYATLFAQRVAAHPQRLAAVCNGDVLTYAELDARASHIAAALIEAGAEADTLVAVAMERGLALLTSMVAVFKAGAAYLPLDLNHPPQRLADILNLSQAPIVLTTHSQCELIDQLLEKVSYQPQVLATKTICQQGPIPALPIRGAPTDLAYVIFTSGSTGTPKGAMVEQRGMLNNIFGKVPTLDLGEADRIAQTASIAFDISIWQFLAAPLLGAAVHILPDEVSRDPARLLSALQKQALTVLEAVPAVIRALLQASSPATRLPALRWLLPTGEALPPTLCRDWFSRFPIIPLINAYGPAECADDVAFYPLTSAAQVEGEQALAMPIGRPTANNQIYILDAALRPVPIGVTGEICIAGTGVGRGYLHDPQLTQRAFPPHPFKPGERFYRSGDLGRYRASGVIEFLGRRDQQVKIRGHRIELGEIEQRLQAHPLVLEAAIIARPDPRGETQLIAYWVGQLDGEIEGIELGVELGQQLPSYMVPALFIKLDALPLNTNGKVDHRQLTQREPDWSGNLRESVAPRTDTEHTLYQIWTEILALDTLGVEDNFFALGGHSLLATQVMSRLRAAFRVELPLKALFEHPTVALLARAVDQYDPAKQQVAAPAAISPQARPARIPLSFAQQRLWFIEQLSPGTTHFNIPFAIRLKGRVDRDALRHSLQQLIDRHEVLRTAFLTENGEPYQQILPSSPFALTDVQLHLRPGQTLEQAQQAALQDCFQSPFDLTFPPLLRAHLIELEPQTQILAICLHHLVSDAWSATLAMRELAQTYGALQAGGGGRGNPHLPPPAIQYADFALWQRAYLQGDILQGQLDYWTTRFTRDHYLLNLPTDHTRPAVQSYRAGSLETRLSTALSDRVHAFASAQRLTPFSVVFAAFAALLHRISGEAEIVLGTPASDRSRPETEAMLGILLNNLAIRADFCHTPSFTQLARQIHSTLLDAQAHQDLPFEQLVDHLDLPRSMSHAPLFQVMVAQQLSVERRIQFPGLTFDVLDTVLSHSEHDLDLHIATPAGEPIALELMYAQDLFHQDTAQRWLARLLFLLGQLLQNPDKPVAEAPVVTPAEWQQILEWNHTRKDFPLHQSYGDLFAKQVAKHPQKIAAVCQAQSLTYSELDARASQLAFTLLEAGAGTDTPVAVLAQRGLGFLVSAIAILKTGAALLPLEVKHPRQRLTEILHLSKAPLLLAGTDEVDLANRLCSDLAQPPRVLAIDALLHRGRALSVFCQGSPNNLAYIIFTSGSTGTPKGALVEQRGMINNIFGKVPTVKLCAQDRIAQTASVAFDISIWQFLAAPLLGASVHILPDSVSQDPAQLLAALEQQEITLVEAVPAVIRALLASATTQTRLTALRWLLPTGEALPPALCRDWFSRFPHIPLMNVYGPAECSDDVAFYPITQAPPKDMSTMPIGQPTANNQLFILDPALRPTPIGVPGEICVAGVGVGRGYLHNPQQTRAAFVPHPFPLSDTPSNTPSDTGRGNRFYRTGDLGRHRADGTIEFLGRRDQQVKIRGHRIELGEIETRLQHHPGVNNAAVITRPDARGEPQLVAYWVRQKPIETDSGSLRDDLGRQLPPYMVPALLQELDALPLNANGKVDRGQLAQREPDWCHDHTSIAPRTPTEQTLYNIWAEVLEVDNFGVEDNFFALGGHSLLATVLFARIAEQFQCTPKLRELFEHPTIAGLAALVGEPKIQARLTPPPRPRQLPLSFAQQRLWFLEQLHPGTGEYNITSAIELSGTLQVEWLRQGFERVVHRHEILRSRIVESKSGAELQIDPTGPFPLPVQTTPTSEAEWPELMRNAADQEARRAFDLGRDCLIRARLLQRQDSAQALLLLTLHHTVADDWSIQLLIDEAAEVYRAAAQQRPPSLPELPIQYVDYSLWQQQTAQQNLYQRQLTYWQNTLDNGDYLLDLPTDHPRGNSLESAAGNCFTRLPEALSAQLRAFAQRHQATPYMVLLAALNILLGSYANQRDLRIGTPVANRRLGETQALIGCFTNTLVIRSELTPQAIFSTYLQQLKQHILTAQENQDVPFEQVVEALAPERDLNRTPLFQVLFVMQNTRAQDLDWPDLEIREVTFASPAAKFDLNWEIHDDQQHFSVMLEYRASLFREATMERWLQEWQTLLEDLVSEPARALGEYSALSAEARQQQLVTWNTTHKTYPGPHTLAKALSAQAQRSPHATALTFQEPLSSRVELSYAQLHARANQLAHFLRQQGVGRETIVALCLSRSIEMVVALLGIVKAGGAYLPLDPELPPARLALMVEDAEPALVLTHSQWRQQLPDTATLHCLDHQLPDNMPTTEPEPLNHPEDLAYVIYTSGSTGQPKGVLNEHRALMNRLYWMQDAFPIDAHDRVLQKTPYSFDVSVWEFFWPLLTGACLVVAKPGGHQDSAYLVELIQRERITTLHFVPSMLQAFIAEPGLAQCTTLHQAFASGEALPLDLQQRFISRQSAQLINLYGPTEAAIDVSVWRCDPHTSLDTVPIGKPIANLQLYILDANRQLLPPGAIGELYIGGVGLARGYLKRPALTDERFVPHPFCAGERLYRSGDRCRFLPDGNIDYLGRVDHQVKLRGLRIELGEIDAALLKLDNVCQAVTVLNSDLATAQLLSYVVARDSHLDTEAICAALSTTLPTYMVPTRVLQLPELPLNSSGKIDRKRLPKPDTEPETELETGTYTAPQGEVETALAQLWAEVLERPPEQISRRGHFFRLGGHSLLATLLLAQMRQQFAHTPSLRQVFERPVLADMAALTNGLGKCNGGELTPRSRPRRLPLSFAQQRLWFLEQLDSDSAQYNITSAVELTGPLNPEYLQRGLTAILQRHEVLRSHFLEHGAGAQVVIDSDTKLTLTIEQVEVDDLAWKRLLRETTHSEASTPFNLARDCLIRGRLLQRADKAQSLLLLTLHHTVADDWSMQCLVDELAQCYRAYMLGGTPQLAPLAVQYMDYSLWQREPAQTEAYQQQLDYWTHTLEDGDYALDLPTDHPRTVEPGVRAGSQVTTLSPTATRKLRHYADSQGVTVYILLLAITQVLLGRLANQRDVRIGTAVANRRLAETQDLIGCFVNSLVIRADLNPQLDFPAFLTQVKQTVLAAQENQDVPFEQVVDTLAPARDLSRTPLFQVLFAMQHARLKEDAWAPLQLHEIQVPPPATTFELNWEVHDNQDNISMRITYRRDLFKANTITCWTKIWQRLLKQVLDKQQTPLASLALLEPAARRQQLLTWNNTDKVYPGPHTLADALAAQAQRSPHAPALVFESTQALSPQAPRTQLSYAELHARANQLAHTLRQQGVGRETIVALCLSRSIEMVVALLGIVKAGGAYLPLDPELPPTRLALMLDDAKPALVLTHSQWRRQLPQTATLHCLDEVLPDHTPTTEPEPINRPEDLAYVIYTSGSTGKPKGVLNEHRALMNRLYWMQDAFPIDAGDRVLQKTPYSFDVSVWEFFWPLLTGACLVLAKPGGHQDSAYLVELIQREAITTVHFVPSMLQAFTEEPGLAQCNTLRQVFASGEALPLDLQQRFIQRQQAQLINLYGPTEAAIDVSVWRCSRHTKLHTVPIGKPIANLQLYILDANGQLLPPGAIGELYIGGVGLARGYLKRPELTQERFVPHPFCTGERLYRSGDRCRFLPDGNIEYLGRVDHQVKLRGLRIELGEIDTALLTLENVRQAVTVLSSDLATAQLLSYVVARDGQLDTEAIRAALATTLPAYMVPTRVVELPKLPLSSNGKIDRKRLPQPDSETGQSTWAAPSTDTESTLCELLEKLLKLERVGINDNFFSLGGDSILGLQFIAQARAQGVGLTPKQLFQQPTVADLARVATAVEQIDAEQGVLQGAAPLLPIQYWLLEQRTAEKGYWNQSLLLKPSRALSPATVKQSLQHLLAQHDALRLHFEPSGETWQQIYTDTPGAFGFEQLTVSDTAALKAALTPFTTFDLTRGPLFQAVIIDIENADAEHSAQRLYLAAHHLVVDTVSWRIVLEDFSALYLQLEQGATPATGPKTSSYRQWGEHLLQHAQSTAIQQQRTYWEQQAAAPTLPVDYPDKENVVADEMALTEYLTASETSQLQQAQQSYRTQGHELLVTALALTLSQWSGKSKVRIDLEGHGREALFPDLDISRTVGWFTSLYPISLQLPDSGASHASIISVKEQLRALPDQGLGYGLLRYLSQPPLVSGEAGQVLFNYLGKFSSDEHSGLLSIADEDLPAERAPQNNRSHELEINVLVLDKRLQVEWRFSTARYRRDTQQKLLRAYREQLQKLIQHCLHSESGNLSPADFPLAKDLNQKSLDKLLGKLKSAPVAESQRLGVTTENSTTRT